MPKNSVTVKKRSNVWGPGAPEMLPASCELPREVHAQVTSEATVNDRTFAAQLRVIVKEWAAKQPATP